LYQFTKRVTKLTVIIIVGYHCYQLQHFIEYPSHIDGIVGDHQCGFRRNRSTADNLFTDFEKAYDSVRSYSNRIWGTHENSQVD
jgi:hypothetical protein